MGHIDHVQQQVGSPHFFERTLERVHQLMRQLVDEADRIDQDDGLSAREVEAAARRVEGGE